jgi:hypothetical protein
MLSELHSLNLKLYSKQYNKKKFAPDCGATIAGDITAQPKQGRQATPMSSLCILYVYDWNIHIFKILTAWTFKSLTRAAN